MIADSFTRKQCDLTNKAYSSAETIFSAPFGPALGADAFRLVVLSKRLRRPYHGGAGSHRLQSIREIQVVLGTGLAHACLF